MLGEANSTEDLAGAVRDEVLRDVFSCCVATATLSVVHDYRARFTNALDLAAEAVALSDRNPGHEIRFFPLHLFEGLALVLLERRQEARDALHRGRRLAEDSGAIAPLLL